MAQVRHDPPEKRRFPGAPSRLPERPVLPREVALEIDNFEAEVARFTSGELSPERFRAFRLAHGVYGQRQQGVQMIRVKIPTGALTGAQMRRLADMAEAFSPTGLLHLTTRQDVQVHYVQLARVPHFLRLLAEVGLTTREACGNSVRNVTSCPVSGSIADELFDVQPYALATYAYLVRNPFCQQLARKFKIAFSSCPEDCASTAIHDIGLVGRIESGGGAPRYGFKVLVGGGLGSTPFTARVLAEFVPVEELLPTMKGILQVFSAHGNRRNKMKARLKFVVHKHGIESFRKEVAEAVAVLTAEEREEADLFAYVPDRYLALVARHAGLAGREGAGDGVAPAENGNGHGARSRAELRAALPACAINPNDVYASAGLMKGICGEPEAPLDDPAFLRWQSTNVRRHHDPARAVVTISFPLGDLDANRFRALSTLVTAHAGDEARIAIHQDLVLPNVPRARLRALYDGLAASDLAEASAGTALNVTSCPGADTCGLGITSSKGLARAIRSELLPMADNGGLDLLRGVTIKMSGCPNSCGQHHVANIGFHGVAKKVDGRMIPAYQLHLGGRIGPGDARIGEALDKIPAKNVPRVVAALLELYKTARLEEEPFADFVQRWPREGIEAVLAPFVNDIAPDGGDVAIDWGQEAPFTTDEIGTGECAGAGIDAVVDPFDNYVAEVRQGMLFLEREQWADGLANLSRSRYTLARVLLDALGKHPDTDYETACELRAQVIDRGYASELWNELGASIEPLLATRRPDPAAIRALYERSHDLLDEAKKIQPFLALKKASGGGSDIPA